MKDKLIGVLMGGVSREREISLRSGRNVAAALVKLGYQVKSLDVVNRNCAEQLKAEKIEVAFNILHGTFGEDGGIQQILEDLKIPYTGSGVQASRHCMDKVTCKEILIKAGFPTPDYQLTDTLDRSLWGFPLMIKARREGSSFGVVVVKTAEEFQQKFPALHQEFQGDIFLEQYIAGTEVTVGVVKSDEKIIPLPILELVPKNVFYDFEAKYTPGGTRFILPADLTPTVTAEVKKIAADVFKVLNCEGAVRVDFIIEQRKTPYILEVNTIPGMTDQSDLPAEAKAHGWSFTELVEKVLHTASLNKY